jgi:hypothetical protein
MPDGIRSRPLALLPTFPQPAVRPMFRALGIAASGLSAQRQRIEVVAENLANVETTRGADGRAYQRRVAVLQQATGETPLFGAVPGAPGLAGTVSNPVAPFGPRAFQVPAYAGQALACRRARTTGCTACASPASPPTRARGRSSTSPGTPTPTRTATCAIRT